MIQYKERTYKCPHCGTIQKRYMWDNDVPVIVFGCEECNKPVQGKDLHETKAEVPGIRTPTKNRV